MGRIKARLDIIVDPPISVNSERCDLCGACVGICPANCIGMDEHRLWVELGSCIKCGFCIPTCPLGALSWNEDSETDGRGVHIE
ncbi:MAG: DUF362 domain-containing protein [bacterium]